MSTVRVRYVALGDSTGVGVGGREGGYVEHLFQQLRAGHAGVGLLNLSVSGATSGTVLSGQLPRALKARPHLVTLGVGVNDVWRGVGPAQFESHLSQLAERLHAVGAQVVLGNLPDMTHAPVARLVVPALFPMAVLSERLAAFNAAVARVAQRHGCALVDVFGASRHELAVRTDSFCADGFHPSDVGYRRLADVWWPHLAGAAERLTPPEAQTGQLG